MSDTSQNQQDQINAIVAGLEALVPAIQSLHSQIAQLEQQTTSPQLDLTGLKQAQQDITNAATQAANAAGSTTPPPASSVTADTPPAT